MNDANGHCSLCSGMDAPFDVCRDCFKAAREVRLRRSGDSFEVVTDGADTERLDWLDRNLFRVMDQIERMCADPKHREKLAGKFDPKAGQGIRYMLDYLRTLAPS